MSLYFDDIAPMASNSTDSVQSSSSQPPANMMSCLPHWISLGGVADAMVGGRAGRRDRIVDALDLEPGRERRRRGRRHRLRHRERADALGRPWSRVMSAASTMVRVDGPPEPMMMPVRSLEMSLSSRPAVADRLLHRDMVPGRAAAEEAHGAAVDHLVGIERRRAVHLAAEAELGVFVGARRCRTWPRAGEASTSCVLLPMDETMPIPVTTTRLMLLHRCHSPCTAAHCRPPIAQRPREATDRQRRCRRRPAAALRPA